jgi:phosphatidylserine/phosphatidylglycerophosphate/cardiolipin synthase-like enzyme
MRQYGCQIARAFFVKCLVQPDDGVSPIIKGINSARQSIEIVIFRFSQAEIERALTNAVTRGVHVHALIANTNRGGEKNLRELEMRLLAAGVTVARTNDELVRYHGKMMIVDSKTLYVLGFNFTALDIERSRSFGIITSNQKHVTEAAKLFQCDTQRQPYTSGIPSFVVSPVNARKQLATFIRGAKKQLFIYDPETSDPEMIRLLEVRARAGVDVRIIGKLAGRPSALPAARTLQVRLHTRTIVRDGTWAFVGSQSLRALELDARREVGIIFRDPKCVDRILKTFQSDWESKAEAVAESLGENEPAEAEGASVARVAKKVAKAVVDNPGPVSPVVEMTFRELSGLHPEVELDRQQIEETVRDAVKDALKQAVREIMDPA